MLCDKIMVIFLLFLKICFYFLVFLQWIFVIRRKKQKFSKKERKHTLKCPPTFLPLYSSQSCSSRLELWPTAETCCHSGAGVPWLHLCDQGLFRQPGSPPSAVNWTRAAQRALTTRLLNRAARWFLHIVHPTLGSSHIQVVCVSEFYLMKST